MSLTASDVAANVLWRCTATQIATRVRAGKISAADVLESFIARIGAVNPRLNALVFSAFDAARETARAIDVRRARGEVLGLLAGVPVSIKDCFDVHGMPTTLGLLNRRDHIAEQESVLVSRLRAADAVILGKTNVPQLMVAMECDNPLYGRTVNPWNAARSPGGSTGGEAALIAAGGSALGLASDMAGSTRQPAHSCGIAGLMPTGGRLSCANTYRVFDAVDGIQIQPGPLARCVDDLSLAMRALLPASPDACASDESPVVWRDPEAVDIRQIRVGYWAADGFFHPSPAVRRAVEESIAALSAAGVTVERVAPPDVHEAQLVVLGLLSADGAASSRVWLGSSEPYGPVKRIAALAKLGQPWRWLLATTLACAGQRRSAELLRETGRRSTAAYWDLVRRRNAYAERFFAWLCERRFDALVCPPHSLPALTHGSFSYLPTAGSSTILANLVGLPAGVTAVTRVRAGEESDRRASRDMIERAALGVEANSAGLPVGVQVIGRPWREDVVLALMKAIETAAERSPEHPRTPIDPR